MKKIVVGSLLAVSMASWSVASFAQAPAPAPANKMPVPEGSQKLATMLSDSQILEIVRLANQFEKDSSKLAQDKTKENEVKMFSQQLQRDHEGLLLASENFEKKALIKPQKSDLSQTYQKTNEDKLAKLKNLKGSEFDRAFVQHEIEFHQQLLTMLEQDLMPKAQHAELKAILDKSRPTIQMHLQHAKDAQVALKRDGAKK